MGKKKPPLRIEPGRTYTDWRGVDRYKVLEILPDGNSTRNFVVWYEGTDRQRQMMTMYGFEMWAESEVTSLPEREPYGPHPDHASRGAPATAKEQDVANDSDNRLGSWKALVERPEAVVTLEPFERNGVVEEVRWSARSTDATVAVALRRLLDWGSFSFWAVVGMSSPYSSWAAEATRGARGGGPAFVQGRATPPTPTTAR